MTHKILLTYSLSFLWNTQTYQYPLDEEASHELAHPNGWRRPNIKNVQQKKMCTFLQSLHVSFVGSLWLSYFPMQASRATIIIEKFFHLNTKVESKSHPKKMKIKTWVVLIVMSKCAMDDHFPDPKRFAKGHNKVRVVRINQKSLPFFSLATSLLSQGRWAETPMPKRRSFTPGGFTWHRPWRWWIR